ncbi:MAG: molybdopterin-dependent oxidoreductase [Armatimonadetes bacterium]|nr:molybdopterin-dependent oxidoreductase [Armatimonadota bacterium]
MPTLTIDGIEVTVPDKTNLIEAAKMVGAEIPHYCYHPGLSVAGNCRMCLVEIEKAPKLAIGCFTPCQEGMVVHTSTEKVLQARKDVLEFLLINHPLDCPVCDQAGECWLQIYYMKHGQYESRMMEDKIKKHKKATAIGPTVTLDQERCILCARCVRFCDEISKTSELGIFNRGNHAELDVFPGKELNNKYSGNVVDICPVGALTDRDFRFQCRVWYLDTQDSICPGCSRGCNIQVHYNLDRPHHAEGRRVLRLKPRFNPEVNKYWICDEGRYGYKFIDDESRILMPQVMRNGGMEFVSWDEALKASAEKIKASIPEELGVLASPQLTNEELYLIRKLFVEELGATQVEFRVPPKEEGYSDDYLVKADKNPNTKGAEEIGLAVGSAEEILKAAAEKKLSALVIFVHNLVNSGLDDSLVKAALEGVETLIFIGSNFSDTSEKANVILPSATYAEKSGTFANSEGRVQRIHEAVPPLGESLPEWQILNELARALGLDWDYQGTEHIFAELAKDVPAFANLTYEILGDQGQTLGYVPPAEEEALVEHGELEAVRAT